MALVSGPVVVLALALGLELVVGDPISRWHPVAVFGRSASLLVDSAPSGPNARLGYGAALVVGAVVVVFVTSALTLQALASFNLLLAVAAGAALLKVSFSIRQLEQEAARAALLLERDGVAAARRPLSALVSRELDGLSPELAASAAIESLAENFSDSFVAPLFYYVVLGVPGALAYRGINTLDAMIGYHGRYEHLGRAAAKLDDVVNLVPARIAALLLVAGAAWSRADWRRAAETALRDHGQTESPNAGWPMAVMAGALHVQLEKRGHYYLGGPGAEASPAAIRQAIVVVRGGVVLACALAVLALASVSLLR